MDSDLTTTICFTAIRAIHFGACLLILGVWTFDRIVLAPATQRKLTGIAVSWMRIARWLMLLSLTAALISGLAWFALVAIDMSGLPPAQALQPRVLRLVWSQTQFGGVWKLRCVFWLASGLTAALIFNIPAGSRLRSRLIWLATLFGALLLGSLAWSGHGKYGEPAGWHLLADSVHLVVASMWPTGLLPLTLILLCLRQAPSLQQWAILPPLLNRFSAMSLTGVGILAATGIANSCFMLRSASDLFHSLYGQILLLKITLFCLMVGIGAINLLRLRKMPNKTAPLQIAIGIELLLGIAVILAVALLGLIMPPHM